MFVYMLQDKFDFRFLPYVDSQFPLQFFCMGPFNNYCCSMCEDSKRECWVNKFSNKKMYSPENK